MDKRGARRAFKERVTPKGIFVIRCAAAGEAWVDASTHLDSEKNGAWFQLRNGLHRNQEMQAAWTAHGEAAFEYAILETLDDDVSPLLLRDLLAQRKRHWELQLAPCD